MHHFLWFYLNFYFFFPLAGIKKKKEKSLVVLYIGSSAAFRVLSALGNTWATLASSSIAKKAEKQDQKKRKKKVYLGQIGLGMIACSW